MPSEAVQRINRAVRRGSRRTRMVSDGKGGMRLEHYYPHSLIDEGESEIPRPGAERPIERPIAGTRAGGKAGEPERRSTDMNTLIRAAAGISSVRRVDGTE